MPSRLRLVHWALLILLPVACGKDSYITEAEGPVASVEFGDGVEIFTPADTLIRLFTDFEPITYQNRPAIRLQELVGPALVALSDLYGYRFIGTDGYYANMPSKGYGDNTWDQLGIGYLNLVDFSIQFETERDSNLRKGHNVKWLIRIEVLRSIDIDWGERHKLAPVAELEAQPLPEGYLHSGSPAVCLTDAVEYSLPVDLDPQQLQYRVLTRQGSGLPRPLTWQEMHTAYHILALDLVVMPDVLGPAYRLEHPKLIRVAGGS